MSAEETLAERLGAALLPTDEDPDAGSRRSSADRILDAALTRFAAVGIDATTMSSIATEAGLSREWLYRHFANKDAVVTAAVHRELRRFIDGLAAGVEWGDDLDRLLTGAFVYCVEYFRDRPQVDGLLDRTTGRPAAEVRARAGTVVALATHTCAGYLVDRGGIDATRAAVIAETLVRLVGSTVLVPRGQLDLHDPVVLRDYASRVVPAVVRDC